ncbi:MAG: hypothetical protein K0S71_1587 [Clostridia bacterium]|jgi:HEAT repeat protein|nr:hypothetical protein [Clostridia bacterium]
MFKKTSSIGVQSGISIKNKRLSAIPEVFQLLLSRHKGTRLQAAKRLSSMMCTLSSSQLIKVDKVFRERSSYIWGYKWSNKKPEDLFHPLMTEEEKLTILGLSSFHPDGYFREKAIRRLSEINTDFKIPYLLIRMNDWVKEIREVSQEYLLSYLKPENARAFINNLPLVYRLESYSRNAHDDSLNVIISMLSSEECSSKLIEGLHSADPKVRLLCYKIMIQAGVLDNKSLINYLLKDSYPYIRLCVLKAIQKTIAADEIDDISQQLLQDKSAQIRIIALETLHKYKGYEAVDTLEKSLFDKNQTVRRLARDLLNKYKEYDYSSIYRHAIYKNEDIYACICGLGETGNISDAKIITEFILADSVKIVRASLYALSKLDFKGYKEQFIFLLKDLRPGVSKAAKRVLYGQINNNDEKTIYDIFKEAIYDHVKVNTCTLLCSLSKWVAIRYILEFCADKDQDISARGRHELESWKLRINRSFTNPSKDQVEEIRKSMNRFGEAIKDSDKEFIEFTIKNFH